MDWTTAGLWLAVIGSGLYHGINPGMGWPLAVTAGLMGGGRRALAASLGPLAVGHLLAMLSILLPFALMTALLTWQTEIRIGAGLLVITFGAFRLVFRRHPRALARIPPTRLALWSFAIATAHGAGMMLLPIYLGLCAPDSGGAGHAASAALMERSVATAALVASVHALAMVAAGGLVALLVHDWLGMKFLTASWFNLEYLWAASLILVGVIGVATA